MQSEMAVREELEDLATLQTDDLVGLNRHLGTRLGRGRRVAGHSMLSLGWNPHPSQGKERDMISRSYPHHNILIGLHKISTNI
jgi:hypothetical protein